MRDTLINVALQMCVMLPAFVTSLAILWRLRSKGAWTLALPFVLEIVFLLLGYTLAPHAMRYHRRHLAPVPQGLAMGSVLPVVFMLPYHIKQWQKK